VNFLPEVFISSSAKITDFRLQPALEKDYNVTVNKQLSVGFHLATDLLYESTGISILDIGRTGCGRVLRQRKPQIPGLNLIYRRKMHGSRPVYGVQSGAE
jgi:hypothetical protein